MTVQSPCTSRCLLNVDRICTGCGRTVSEITAWSSLDDQQRAEAVKAARLRYQQLQTDAETSTLTKPRS
ncbi:MAG: DUF1289 domain-containing protein [Planctomycetota bacterium]